VIYKYIIKPIFFQIDPEKAHYLAMDLFRFFTKFSVGKRIVKFIFSTDYNKKVQALGLTFSNPVGLGAGFDKNAKYIEELASLGFGFIEIGTVTPRPQYGNDKPRLFRLPDDEALINRMGFNNDGVDIVVERLKSFQVKNVIIGGNIGKNKDTPNENAVDDYKICLEKLHDYVDYFVVNVSSPNTPGLRALQEKEPLTHLLNTLQQMNNAYANPKPILLKIAPDLTIEQLDDVIDILKTTGIAGLIATNTTLSRDGLKTSKEDVESIGNGGVSGKPLAHRANEVLQYIKKQAPSMFVISVGGIHHPQEASERLKAGADLIQVYTGFIYQGPSFIKAILKGIKGV
jgi:dihydroorotate dehydrogenase